MTPTSILLSNGKYFDVNKPDPKALDLDVIARALSLEQRYANQLHHWYSVAEHTCVCVEHVKTVYSTAVSRTEWYERPTLRQVLLFKRAIFVHDFSEAILRDIPGPIKTLLPDYQYLERQVQDACCQRFLGIPTMPDRMARRVHSVDRLIGHNERTQFAGTSKGFISPVFQFLKPSKAERAFLELAVELGIE